MQSFDAFLADTILPAPQSSVVKMASRADLAAYLRALADELSEAAVAQVRRGPLRVVARALVPRAVRFALNAAADLIEG